MLFAALIALVTTASGALLTYLYDPRATIGARLCAGVAIGSCLLGFSGYIACACVRQMNAPSLLFAVVTACLPLTLLLRRPALRAQVVVDLKSLRVPRRPRRWAFLAVGGLTIALLCVLFRGTMYIGPNGGVWTDNHHNIGDLPWHMAVVQDFVIGQNFPPQHPEYAGINLTYPFLVDFLNAQYVQAGASLVGSVLLQNVLLGVALVGLFLRWAMLLTRRVFAALAALLLVLLSGGWGFVLFFHDHLPGQSFLALLQNIPRDYTRDDGDNLKWGNALTVLLTTQRGLMLAIPLALMVATLWWQDRQHISSPRSIGARSERRGERGGEPARYPLAGGGEGRLRVAGILTGLLPLIHGHTYLSLLLVGAGLALQDVFAAAHQPLNRGIAVRERLRAWLGFFGFALLLAVPQAWAIRQSSAVHGASFIGLQLGWDHGDMPIVPFYLWNLGAFIPLLIVALIVRRRIFRPLRRPLLGNRLLRYYAPFLICFVVPNIVRLAPWDWDNMKMLFYWHLASSVVIAAFLAQLWNARRRWLRLLTRPLTLGLFALLTLAGAIDVARIGQGTLSQETYTPDGIRFARAVIANTPTHALLLHYPLYSHPATLTGRRLLCGYDGHLWSHGIDFDARKADVVRIYAGAPAARDLLARYGVDYVIVGPLERTNPYNLGVVADESFFARNYPVAVKIDSPSGPWTLYRVRDSAMPAAPPIPADSVLSPLLR